MIQVDTVHDVRVPGTPIYRTEKDGHRPTALHVGDEHAVHDHCPHSILLS